MKWSTLLLLVGFVAPDGHAATLFTYDIPAESLTCNSANCPAGSTINLSGTITTDGVGQLNANAIVAWDLTVTLTGQTPIRLTQNIGSFSTTGSPTISATSSNLTVTANTPPDGFLFSGNTTFPATWLYGAVPPAEILFFNTTDGSQYTALRMLTLPSTFTATLLSTVDIPEPASLLLIAIAGLLLFTFARKLKLRF